MARPDPWEYDDSDLPEGLVLTAYARANPQDDDEAEIDEEAVERVIALIDAGMSVAGAVLAVVEAESA